MEALSRVENARLRTMKEIYTMSYPTENIWKDPKKTTFAKSVDTPVRDWYDLGCYRLWDVFVNKYLFLPVEVLGRDTTASKELLEKSKSALDSSGMFSEKDEVISVCAYLEASCIHTGELVRVTGSSSFRNYLISYRSRCNSETSETVLTEYRKLTEYMYFTSEKMIIPFIERSCPLIYDCIEKWRLLNEIKCLVE